MSASTSTPYIYFRHGTHSKGQHNLPEHSRELGEKYMEGNVTFQYRTIIPALRETEENHETLLDGRSPRPDLNQVLPE